MINVNNWLTAVVQLFDHIIRALMGEAFFSALLQVMVFLLVFGLLSYMFKTSKKM